MTDQPQPLNDLELAQAAANNAAEALAAAEEVLNNGDEAGATLGATFAHAWAQLATAHAAIGILRPTRYVTAGTGTGTDNVAGLRGGTR